MQQPDGDGITLQAHPDVPSARQLNDILTDEQRTLALFREMVNQAHSDDSVKPSFSETELSTVARQLSRELTTSGGEANLRQVFANAESPIERAFLNSFLFKMTLEDLLSVVVFGPVPDLDSHMAGMVSEYNGFVDWLTGFFHFKGAKTLNEAYEELDFWRNTGRMPDDSYYHAQQMLGANGLVDFVNAFHVMIQPTMKLNGKTVRPDLVVWVPADPNVKIVAECDGFAFHSDKHTFQRDRIRDRRLMELGFQVRRYSGPEIFANPIAAGRDLADYLFGLSRARRPKLIEEVQSKVRSLQIDV